jgi:hypothetical protein
MNVQYAVKDGDDLRARGQSARFSRTVPVRRQGDRPCRSPSIAARLMAGEPLVDFKHQARQGQAMSP